MTVFIGVDVGKDGGFAFIDQHGTMLRVERMPETDADILEILFWVDREMPLTTRRAVLEKVHATPQMGVTSAFSFGGSYRALRMALTAARVPFSEVSPMKWQRRMECLSGGDKNITKARAQQLFPNVKVNHYIADSLLLAEYARRLELWPNFSDPSSSTRKGAGSGKDAATPTATASGGASERIESHGDDIADLFQKK